MIKLYDYQIDAIRRMKNGCVLCGGVGSGKSFTAIGYYYLSEGGEVSSLIGEDYIPMSDPPRDLYIITTARKRDTCEWDKELSPFLLSRDPEANLYCNKIIVDSWNAIHKYADIKNAFFIFDEQRVVGRGVWVKSFLKIAKSNDWILLSATPGDTWAEYIPVFIANGFYRNRSEFIREHVIYSRACKFPKVERYLGEYKLERLRDSILVDMDFKRPTIQHHEDIFVPFDANLYKRILRERWDVWKDEPIENAGGLCYALRKAVNSDWSRADAVKRITAAHPRAIIFYSFDYELAMLKTICYGDDVKTAEWNGHKHEPIPEGEKWVYFVNYSAGAEGWNCITTDTIIFFSQNYSYKVLTQACGRTDRLNTPYRDLYYYHIKSHSGIDTAISRALRDKKTFNESRFIKW
nr:MAG TPA: Chromatin remodeling complex ATPase [Caudoviricetes sp.]